MSKKYDIQKKQPVEVLDNYTPYTGYGISPLYGMGDNYDVAETKSSPNKYDNFFGIQADKVTIGRNLTIDNLKIGFGFGNRKKDK